MQWFKNKIQEHQFYKITKDGDQVSMMESTPYAYILHIQNDVDGMKYHFVTDSYDLVVPYKAIGMSVYIKDTSYIIHPHEFIIQGNNLFNETLTLWLCKHYLYITPCETSKLTIIDTNIEIHTCDLLHVHNQLQNDIKLYNK